MVPNPFKSSLCKWVLLHWRECQGERKADWRWLPWGLRWWQKTLGHDIYLQKWKMGLVWHGRIAPQHFLHSRRSCSQDSLQTRLANSVQERHGNFQEALLWEVRQSLGIPKQASWRWLHWVYCRARKNRPNGLAGCRFRERRQGHPWHVR